MTTRKEQIADIYRYFYIIETNFIIDRSGILQGNKFYKSRIISLMIQNCTIIQENSMIYNLPLVGLLTLLIGKLLLIFDVLMNN